MYDDLIIRNSLLSVIELGESSPHFKLFFKVCIGMSCISLSTSKNIIFRNELLNKLDCSLHDLACDCIADLFAQREGKFVYINKHFERKFPGNLDNVKSTSLVLQLRLLIKSRTSQRISVLREETGEIYFKVKKIVETTIHRQKDIYSLFISSGVKYILRTRDGDLNNALEDYPHEQLTAFLLLHSFETINVTEVIRVLFNIIGSQRRYKKAVSEHILILTLRDYFNEKVNDSLTTAGSNRTIRRKKNRAGYSIVDSHS